MVVQLVSGTLPVALCFAVIGGYAPLAARPLAVPVAARASSRRSGRRRSTTSPAPYAPGCRCPRRSANLGVRGPEPLRPAFDAFAHRLPALAAGSATRSTGSRSGSPIRSATGSSRDCAIAREVGGGELGRLLRNLSGYLRDEARTRSEMESRQAWTVNGARLAVAAPWVVLLFMTGPGRGDPALRLGGGVVVLAAGAAACVVAYRLMMRIGRLPTERRILS